MRRRRYWTVFCHPGSGRRMVNSGDRASPPPPPPDWTWWTCRNNWIWSCNRDKPGRQGYVRWEWSWSWSSCRLMMQVRRELYAQCFDELIRQSTINCTERGLLLLRVRDELRMTLHAYQVSIKCFYQWCIFLKKNEFWIKWYLRIRIKNWSILVN